MNLRPRSSRKEQHSSSTWLKSWPSFWDNVRIVKVRFKRLLRCKPVWRTHPLPHMGSFPATTQSDTVSNMVLSNNDTERHSRTQLRSMVGHCVGFIAANFLVRDFIFDAWYCLHLFIKCNDDLHAFHKCFFFPGALNDPRFFV